MSSFSRRAFVRNGALALLALGMPPAFVTRPLFARQGNGARRKTLICIFQRGAVDGLSMVVPFGEPEYFARRRSIAIQAPGREGGALDLDGFFGLHPSLAPLHTLYTRGEMAIVNAVGSPHPTRSHFDAQDFMESGTPGVKSTRDGWLNRALSRSECEACARTLAGGAAHSADHTAGQTAMAMAPALRGIAMGPALPLALRGSHPTLAIADLETFGIAAGGDPAAEEAFARVYRRANETVVGSAADGAFEALEILEAVSRAAYREAAGVRYPNGAFGRSLRQIAQLLKAEVPVEIAFADVGGWDTHQAQGGTQGQLARRLDELASGLRALHDDLGDRMDDVVILTMSEFGRTVAENGTGGTDHGHATSMFVLGGGIEGGRILGDWPGLAREQLHEGRDLALTTDFRDLFGTVVNAHLGVSMEGLFPGHTVARLGSLMRA